MNEVEAQYDGLESRLRRFAAIVEHHGMSDTHADLVEEAAEAVRALSAENNIYRNCWSDPPITQAEASWMARAELVMRDLAAENEQLRDILTESLKAFNFTQGGVQYPADHWSTRARAALAATEAS